ncbi:MAG: GNAT family N-acetyltransferase, partial [Bacillota bacterium]|nr:GNAT family N-acetyltransferase [Bacillota bacterium]
DMLYEAIYVEEPLRKGPKEELLAIEGIAHYVRDFGERPFDRGYIVEDEGGNPVGAVWYRVFSSNDKGYGFMCEDIPEVSIALKPEARGRGRGMELMEAIIEEARSDGFVALSLSVDPGNAALRLYEKFGFKKVGTSGTSLVMKLDLK